MNEQKLYGTKSKLIGFGIFFSAVSFLYEYLIDDKNLILTAVIMLIDMIWLVLNVFYLSFIVNKNAGKSVVNAILGSLMYFSGLSGIVLILAEGSASLQVLLKTLETLVYLGPMIIILLPIIYVVMQFLD